MSKLASVVRVPSPSKESCELDQLLESVHILLSAELQERNIEWDQDLCAPPVLLYLDVNQFEQVVINIVRNAMEAIGKDGSITIKTKSDPARLEIVDSGPGIDPTLQQKLFSPFFSSKRDGRGIGLTLSSEILLNHSCGFNLEQHRDGGAIFWIEFPNDSRET
jgi:signal transduction histidine kinase